MSGSTPRWPALKWEDKVWQPATGFGLGRYKASIPPLIAMLTPAPSVEAADAAAIAANELSRFDAELGHRVAAFAPVLLRSESASSSQIENLTASARAIFSAELGAKGSRNADQLEHSVPTSRARTQRHIVAGGHPRDAPDPHGGATPSHAWRMAG